MRLVALHGVAALCIAGRDADVGAVRSRYIASCGTAAVEWAMVDAAESDQVAELIGCFRPDLIVHCASLNSPWLLAGRDDVVAVAFGQAGFAAQLPAQLPLLLAVMAAVKRSGFAGGVINCSYPDVTQPVLHALGMAPTLGIGNAGMIQMMLEGQLRRCGERRRLQVSAHHAHVSMIAAARIDEVPDSLLPRVHLDGQLQSTRELMGGCPGLALDRQLNEITAAHAVAVIAAWLGIAPPLATAVAGVHGLPGGWPVLVGQGQVALDLPHADTVQTLVDYQSQVARMDGVESIDADGTVNFTPALKAALRRWPALCEPLSPEQARARHAVLYRAMVGA